MKVFINHNLLRYVILVSLILWCYGCHAQVPPATTQVVQLSWTAPLASGTWGGCTTANPCTFAIYRCTASATVCADTTNTAWKEITTTRVTGTTFTDSTASGLTTFYVAVTFQGSQNSAPSNMVGPLSVPASPLAPALSAPTLTASMPIQTGTLAQVKLKATVRPS